MHALTIYLGYDIARLCYIIYIFLKTLKICSCLVTKHHTRYKSFIHIFSKVYKVSLQIYQIFKLSLESDCVSDTNL